jgi:hypothetical protein
MEHFPKEFSQLLSRRGLNILQKKDLSAAESFANGNTPIVILPNMIPARSAAACRRLLERSFLGCLQRVIEPISQDLILHAKPDVNEALPKTMEFRTSYFENRHSRAHIAAGKVRLLECMQSASLREFAEAVTGYRVRSHRGTQVICYEPGQSVGPHTDSHPEIPEARQGYVDVHLMFSTPAVKHQYLVYEEAGLFQRIENVALDGAIAIYRLPFWHYSTPLDCFRQREASARRWLLLAGFWIVGDPSRGSDYKRVRAHRRPGVYHSRSHK